MTEKEVEVAAKSDSDSIKAESVAGGNETILKSKVAAKKVPPLPVVERRNWLIHAHFTRKEYNACKSLIKEQLKETQGQCEYAIYIQAIILRGEGETQNSLELFQACHLLNPTNPENLKQIARNLILLGKHKSAIECYNKAAELSEKDWNICHCLGVCYQFLKQYDKAIECYNDALNKNRHLVTYSALSKLYLDNQQTEEAMKVLHKGIEFSPENIELLTSLGLLYLRKNDFHQAFELLGQVLTLDPENYKAILAISALMQQHGDYDVALTKYRVAAQSIPESSSVWNNIGMCYFGKKKYVPAISCLKRAQYHSPFDWKILYNLCLLHLTTQQYASAFQFASSAISLKPEHGPLFALLAVALTHLGQDENAERAYKQAVAFDSKDPYTILNYCIFLHNHSKSQQAAKLLSNFYDSNSQENLVGLDKELNDLAKKLSAALNVGDKLVAENEKVKKKKSKGRGSRSEVASPNSSSSPPPSSTSLSQDPGSEKEEDSTSNDVPPITPQPSSGSTLSPFPTKLAPLLPSLSSTKQNLSSEEKKTRKKKNREEKRTNLTALS